MNKLAMNWRTVWSSLVDGMNRTGSIILDVMEQSFVFITELTAAYGTD